MPRLAGSYKLPSTALLHRPDEHIAINEHELKNLAQVLTEKCGEFDVRGQVVQINPGPVVTTFEFKPDAGIKYSRITSLLRRPLPRPARRKHSDRAHGRQIHRRHPGSQP